MYVKVFLSECACTPWEGLLIPCADKQGCEERHATSSAFLFDFYFWTDYNIVVQERGEGLSFCVHVIYTNGMDSYYDFDNLDEAREFAEEEVVFSSMFLKKIEIGSFEITPFK